MLLHSTTHLVGLYWAISLKQKFASRHVASLYNTLSWIILGYLTSLPVDMLLHSTTHLVGLYWAISLKQSLPVDMLLHSTTPLVGLYWAISLKQSLPVDMLLHSTTHLVGLYWAISLKQKFASRHVASLYNTLSWIILGYLTETTVCQ